MRFSAGMVLGEGALCVGAGLGHPRDGDWSGIEMGIGVGIWIRVGIGMGIGVGLGWGLG